MSKYILNPKIKIFLINDNKVEFFIDNGYDNRKIILYDNENSGKIKELIEFITSLREIDSQTLISELTSKYQISSSDLENLIKTLEYNKILLKVDGDEFSTLLKFLDYNNSFNSLRNVNIIFLDHINNYKFIDIKKNLKLF
ncbi:hypothetical protein HFC64_04485 [Saccharolobus solfataricus]|uniref:Uncharacterized protein n=1 Tax=Saccharolobus solfataricus TaxID=2287 RepID=A0A7S9NQM0_SACSO|nr:hypothetical protein [Saccharolobus solfataricus]QPG49209.1 hypothetical protein HFC64_04485 [Saccharolobus solfataricus]